MCHGRCPEGPTVSQRSRPTRNGAPSYYSSAYPSSVPLTVAAKFESAQKLYVLTWVDFDLIKAGELMALTALELAVTDRYAGKEMARRREAAVKKGGRALKPRTTANRKRVLRRSLKIHGRSRRINRRTGWAECTLRTSFDRARPLNGQDPAKPRRNAQCTRTWRTVRRISASRSPRTGERPRRIRLSRLLKPANEVEIIRRLKQPSHRFSLLCEWQSSEQILLARWTS